MAIFNKGIILTQHKEPAFSQPLVRFVNPGLDNMRIKGIEPRQIATIRSDDIIETAKIAKIVDEWDGKLLYRKLIRARENAIAVIADAVDDEPYVSSKINPLLNLKDEAIGGLELCKRVAKCEDAFIMIYKSVSGLDTPIPRSIHSVKMVRLHGGYPAVSNVSKLKLGEGRKLIVGVGALVHLYRAVTRCKPQSTVFTTVAGTCVANPMNLEVSIGMTVMQVLEKCGLTTPPVRVVCGGPMTGISIFDPEKTLVTYTTRAVLAFKEDFKKINYSCIGCGKCGKVCPVRLSPMYIHRFVENSYYRNIESFDAHMCIGCGTCSYVCPSKLSVAESVKKAKAYAQSHFFAGENSEEEEVEEA